MITTHRPQRQRLAHAIPLVQVQVFSTLLGIKFKIRSVWEPRLMNTFVQTSLSFAQSQEEMMDGISIMEMGSLVLRLQVLKMKRLEAL